MSTAVLEQTEQPQVFDAKAYMDAANRGERPTPGKPAEEKPAEKAPEKPSEPLKQAAEQEAPRLPRSVRRELNRLREELGAAKAEASLLRSLGVKPTTPAPAEEDAEPQRSDYGTDAEYLRAAAKWDRQQEAKQQETQGKTAQQTEEVRAHLKAMDEKAVADIEAYFPDWDEVSAKAAEDEDAPEFVPQEHPQLFGMLSGSEFRAHVLYHWAKNPDALQSMLDLTGKPTEQIRAFHRLEGRLEREYSGKQAAQATKAETPTKDRKHLADAERPGETAADRDVRKPRPSTDVAARGGSAPPEEPAIGSAAWMAKRNQAAFGR